MFDQKSYPDLYKYATRKFSGRDDPLKNIALASLYQ